MSYSNVCPVEVPTASERPSERDAIAATAKEGLAEIPGAEAAGGNAGVRDAHGIRREVSRERLRGSQKSTMPPPS
jgi:hypothetical protein